MRSISCSGGRVARRFLVLSPAFASFAVKVRGHCRVGCHSCAFCAFLRRISAAALSENDVDTNDFADLRPFPCFSVYSVGNSCATLTLGYDEAAPLGLRARPAGMPAPLGMPCVSGSAILGGSCPGFFCIARQGSAVVKTTARHVPGQLGTGGHLSMGIMPRSTLRIRIAMAVL